MQATLLLLLAFANQAPALADGTLVAWGPDTIAGMSEDRWEAAKKLDNASILDRVRGARDWATAYEALLGASTRQADKNLLRDIAKEISNPAQGSLAGTSRLIVWERIRSGDLVFEGKGLQVEDDLFRIAGRANWILRSLLRRSHGFVRPDSTQSDLDAIQAKWLAFLSGEPVPEVPPEFLSERQGLGELRSPAALPALIASLRPSGTKQSLTAACLQNVYGLAEMPTDPAAPAHYCDPDTYTHRYLAALTDETGTHDADWWSAWWQRNQRSLHWDGSKAKFLTASP